MSAQTYEGCLKKFRELQAQLEEREAARTGSRTFASWAEEWLEDYKHHVKRRSYEIAEIELRKHINPRLGELKLSEVSVTHVRRLQNEIVSEVSARTGRGCRNRVLMVLEAAKQEGLLSVNVADAVRRVKQDKKEMMIWSAGEVRRFIDANDGERDFPLFNFYGSGP